MKFKADFDSSWFMLVVVWFIVVSDDRLPFNAPVRLVVVRFLDFLLFTIFSGTLKISVSST
jgi:hypothetical protein